MTTRQIRDLRARLGLTRREFGAVFGASEKSVINWETGARLPHPFVRRLIEVACYYSIDPPMFSMTDFRYAVTGRLYTKALGIILMSKR